MDVFQWFYYYCNQIVIGKNQDSNVQNYCCDKQDVDGIGFIIDYYVGVIQYGVSFMIKLFCVGVECVIEYGCDCIGMFVSGGQ